MKKGFTLIELLVVIAIIGILAAIVLVSLSGARNSAKDARLTADLQQVRNFSEVYQSADSDYHALDQAAADAPEPAQILSDINSLKATTLATADVFFVNANEAAYCAKVALLGGGFWCVDSALNSKKYTTDPTTCVLACRAGNTCKCQ